MFDSYHCPECGITHLGHCREAVLGDPENELDKRRICHECNQSGPPAKDEGGEGNAGAKKRKRGAGTTKQPQIPFLPMAGTDENKAAEMELCK